MDGSVSIRGTTQTIVSFHLVPQLKDRCWTTTTGISTTIAKRLRCSVPFPLSSVAVLSTHGIQFCRRSTTKRRKRYPPSNVPQFPFRSSNSNDKSTAMMRVTRVWSCVFVFVFRKYLPSSMNVLWPECSVASSSALKSAHSSGGGLCSKQTKNIDYRRSKKKNYNDAMQLNPVTCCAINPRHGTSFLRSGLR